MKNFKVGDRVFVTVESDAQFGTYAQAITCKATEATLLPEIMTYSQGAALGSSGLTALYALKQKAGLKSGEYILIHDATGGVGHLSFNLPSCMVPRLLQQQVLKRALRY